MMQQQMVPRGHMYCYPPGRNDIPGVAGGILPVPYDMGAMLPRDAALAQPMPITALASALANAPADQQRTMLDENLYPLLDQLEHEHAAKVTGMLLEMDQTEVLHLLESPDALKAKVAEAMKVIAIDGHFPGPILEVTTNWNIVVNVKNNLDEPFLLMWNGIQHRKNSWQDGVLGTNCPIPAGWNWM